MPFRASRMRGEGWGEGCPENGFIHQKIGFGKNKLTEGTKILKNTAVGDSGCHYHALLGFVPLSFSSVAQ